MHMVDQQYENGQTTITMDTHGLWHTGLDPGGPALALGLLLVGQAERQHLQQMREHHSQQLSLSRQNVPHCHQVPAEQRMVKQCVSEQRMAKQCVSEQRVSEQRVSGQRVLEQRVSEQRVSGQRVLEQRVSEQCLLKQRQSNMCQSNVCQGSVC